MLRTEKGPNTDKSVLRQTFEMVSSFLPVVTQNQNKVQRDDSRAALGRCDVKTVTVVVERVCKIEKVW